ncbi:putative peroxisomal adenine nucleotide transporter 1 [Coleophoma crateriformis]|uniref:Putative peroxisomal adenine nucleotide transporter 1 n=1 Tax=Coleophoma crateriformis TaxID=565419 RepID=A0A3D8QU49_9HELO|nr:putative peroxisomal adenine nucleotide transporter 1 [Coleophoma crateriformis]
MSNIYNSQLVRSTVKDSDITADYQQDAYSLYHQSHEPTDKSPMGPALPALGHALAGSTGTAISNLAIYPLDLIVTRLQVQRTLRKESKIPHSGEYKGIFDALVKIYDEGGIPELYTGVVQDTGKSIVDSFLFFLFYNYIRTNRIQQNGSKLPMLEEFTVGAVAGACSKFFTTPISNIVTRKQTASLIASRSDIKKPTPSVLDIAQQIQDEKGIQGFWSGYSASLVLTLNPSLTFFLYELFKRTLIPRSRRDDPGARVTFLMAAVSKAIASTVTYPFALAKTRAQASSRPPVDPQSASNITSEAKSSETRADAEKTGRDVKNLAKRSTVFAAILKIYREEGPAALYEGVAGEILKGFFSHGITMLVKESVHKVIIQLYFYLLKVLDKTQDRAGDLASSASSTVKDMGDRAGDMLTGVRGRAGEAVTGAGEKIQNSYTSVSQSVSGALESGKDQISSTGSSVSEKAGVVGERVGVLGNNATEAAKTANDLASKEAGHLLGNAHAMLGGKIEGVKNED